MKGEKINDKMETQQTESLTYSQKLESLGLILNNRLTKESVLNFKKVLTDLKNENETELSIKFISGLMLERNNIKRNDKIRRILNLSELKTQNRFRFYKFFDNMGNTIKTKETLRFIIV